MQVPAFKKEYYGTGITDDNKQHMKRQGLERTEYTRQPPYKAISMHALYTRDFLRYIILLL